MLPSLSGLGSANGRISVLLIKPEVEAGGAEGYTAAKAKAREPVLSGPKQKGVLVNV
jgi:hypothetical protein